MFITVPHNNIYSIYYYDDFSYGVPSIETTNSPFRYGINLDLHKSSHLLSFLL